MTKHEDHATQIRLLSLMGVEARLGRAETAPETGNVDEQVCSVESAAEEEKEYEYTEADCEEELIEWVHECMNDWSDEVVTGPFGAGDTQIERTENGEMSPERIVNISSFPDRTHVERRDVPCEGRHGDSEPQC